MFLLYLGIKVCNVPLVLSSVFSGYAGSVNSTEDGQNGLGFTLQFFF